MIGGGEVAFHMACMVADKFGVVTLPDLITPEFIRRWRLMGIDWERITSIRSVNIPVTELSRRKDELETEFISGVRFVPMTGKALEKS